jgi:hypothetical protein
MGFHKESDTNKYDYNEMGWWVKIEELFKCEYKLV